MELAHLGEARTGSKCGRMDQCCALGTNHVAAMFFDGDDVKIYEVVFALGVTSPRLPGYISSVIFERTDEKLQLSSRFNPNRQQG